MCKLLLRLTLREGLMNISYFHFNDNIALKLLNIVFNIKCIFIYFQQTKIIFEFILGYFGQCLQLFVDFICNY